MKWILPIVSLALVSAAHAENTGSSTGIATAPQDGTALGAHSLEAGGQENCRDIIHDVSEGRVLSLDGETAAPAGEAEAQMIYAVDYDVSGCDQLLDWRSGELRPLPEVVEGDVQLRPAQ